MDLELSVLVLGDHATFLSSLAERTRRLGYRAVRAKTPQDAALLAEERGFRFGVALLHSGFALEQPDGAVDAIRSSCMCPDVVAIAVGEPPIEEDRLRLRRAGLELALWEPVGEHALRFLLNRALAHWSPDQLRGEQRVPTDWNARVFQSGREKSASIYSLSCDGAYLATRRPSQKGAELAVEIGVPGRSVSVSGPVLYTNVPGNLRRSCLPDGMAIRFDSISDEDIRRLRDSVAAAAEELAV